jgi:hypothetical protein
MAERGLAFVKTLILLGVFCSTIFFCLTAHTYSQSPAGVSLSPTLIETSADPGEIITENISITNLSAETKTYYIFARDISGVKDEGTPVFAEEGTEKTGYELTEWVTLDVTEATLEPKESKAVAVTINVPENATPGSHFGGIFVALEPPRLRSIGAGVGFEVANIVSIRISGDVIDSAQIRSFSTDNFIYSKTDVEFLARVENKGNVLVRPYGPLEVTNMLGKRVAMITFNEKRGGVFPKSIRDFDLTWQDENPGFGRYEARLSLVYGDPLIGQKTITSVTTFWVLPMNIIGPALIVLLTLLLLVYISVKLYIRRAVLIMSSGRRLTPRRGRQGVSLFIVVSVSMLATTALFLLLLLILFA